MDTKSNRKKTVLFLVISVVLVSSCLIEGIRANLNNLKGEYLPDHFPLVGGYPPNNFLLWGVLIFFVFGLSTVRFIFRKYDDRNAIFAIIFMLNLITFIMILFAKSVTYREGLIWRDEANSLILVWIVAYWAGVFWAYSYRKLRAFFNKSVNNP